MSNLLSQSLYFKVMSSKQKQRTGTKSRGRKTWSKTIDMKTGSLHYFILMKFWFNTENFLFDLYLNLLKEDGSFNGHQRQLEFRSLTPRGIQLPIFGFYEARIDVDAIRNGRSCQFYLIPEAYDLNPDDSTDDTTAKKGASQG